MLRLLLGLLAVSTVGEMLHAADAPAFRSDVVRAIILARTPDIPVVRNTGQFIDLPPGHPQEATMLYAEKLGVITATPQGRLLPYDHVSRAALIVMLARAYELPTGNAIPYDDVAANSWYAPYAHIAETYHLFALEHPRRLEPETSVTMTDVNRALLLITTLKSAQVGPVRIDAPEPLRPSATAPTLYTVISIRRQKVTLVDAPAQTLSPLVRRTAVVRPITIDEKRATILNMVNEIREKNGLKPFTLSKQLELSAQAYADRMIQDGFFGHITPEGQSVQQRIDLTGFTNKTFRQDCLCIPGYALGENLARGQKTAEEAVADWMNSTEHRGAILNPLYTHTGIGLNAGIWVEHFGGVLLP